MSGYSRSCFMCKSKQPRGAKVEYSFHRFPSDASVRSKWLQFCKLTDVDDVSKIWLCSKHFAPSDFINYAQKKVTGYMKLKMGAVPVLYRRERQAVNSHMSGSEPVVNEMFKLPVLQTSAVAEQPITPCNNHIDVSTQTETCLNIDKDSSCTVSYNNRCESSTQTGPLPLMLEETLSPSADSGQTSETELSTPKKRRFAEPRYVGDIRSPDLATPRRAKRSLQIVMNTVEKQTKKVRALQEQRRYMKKKLKSVKDLIDDLKNNSLISEEVATSLMVHIPFNVI